MKKWMAYLPLGLLCGSLVVIGGIWGSVWNHTWSGQLELRHLKGDEKALADFDIQFGITDVRNRRKLERRHHAGVELGCGLSAMGRQRGGNRGGD